MKLAGLLLLALLFAGGACSCDTHMRLRLLLLRPLLLPLLLLLLRPLLRPLLLLLLLRPLLLLLLA